MLLSQNKTLARFACLCSLLVDEDKRLTMQAQAILYFFLGLWHYGAKKSFYKQAIKIKDAPSKRFNKVSIMIDYERLSKTCACGGGFVTVTQQLLLSLSILRTIQSRWEFADLPAMSTQSKPSGNVRPSSKTQNLS